MLDDKRNRISVYSRLKPKLAEPASLGPLLPGASLTPSGIWTVGLMRETEHTTMFSRTEMTRLARVRMFERESKDSIP